MTHAKMADTAVSLNVLEGLGKVFDEIMPVFQPNGQTNPAGLHSELRFSSSGSAEWVIEQGLSMRLFIWPRLTASVMQ